MREKGLLLLLEAVKVDEVNFRHRQDHEVSNVLICKIKIIQNSITFERNTSEYHVVLFLKLALVEHCL